MQLDFITLYFSPLRNIFILIIAQWAIPSLYMFPDLQLGKIHVIPLSERIQVNAKYQQVIQKAQEKQGLL